MCYTSSDRRGGAESTPKGEIIMTEQQLPLAGKIALITGSSQGIGRATAQRFAQFGADIVINFRSNADAATEAQSSIEALGRRCVAIQADVSQEEDVTRLFAEAKEK